MFDIRTYIKEKKKKVTMLQVNVDASHTPADSMGLTGCQPTSHQDCQDGIGAQCDCSQSKLVETDNS